MACLLTDARDRHRPVPGAFRSTAASGWNDRSDSPVGPHEFCAAARCLLPDCSPPPGNFPASRYVRGQSDVGRSRVSYRDGRYAIARSARLRERRLYVSRRFRSGLGNLRTRANSRQTSAGSLQESGLAAPLGRSVRLTGAELAPPGQRSPEVEVRQ